MKYWMMCLVTVCLLACGGQGVWAGEQEIQLVVDGQVLVATENSGAPFVDERQRVLSPLRLTMEALGAEVDWTGSRAVISKDGITVEVPVGECYILSQGQKVSLDTTARLVSGRVYLPIRAVAEAFDVAVCWDGGAAAVLLDSDRPSALAAVEPVTADPVTNAMLSHVNAARAAEGLAALQSLPRAADAAQLRAEESSQFFSHTRPDGSLAFTALTVCGVDYRRAGENLAYGQRTAEQVVAKWLDSPGHRANILDERFTHIGIGHYEKGGVQYWAQLFVTLPS